jgi:tRNA-dihydrouridine synthase
MCDHCGEQIGIKKMRKHLIWYTKGLSGGGELRRRLMRVENMGDIEEIFEDYRR